MTKTLVAIQRQIDKLQQQAEAIRAKEVSGVIERIQVAIDFYKLTPGDLFGVQAGAASKGTRKTKIGASAGAAPKAKAKSAIKYQDGAGNSWTGNGKRPNWFKAALESGRTAEDLRVKA